MLLLQFFFQGTDRVNEYIFLVHLFYHLSDLGAAHFCLFLKVYQLTIKLGVLQCPSLEQGHVRDRNSVFLGDIFVEVLQAKGLVDDINFFREAELRARSAGAACVNRSRLSIGNFLVGRVLLLFI